MKIGDVVRFVGFFWEEEPESPKSTSLPHHEDIGKIGIVLDRFVTSEWEQDFDRFDVAWSDGTIGHGLYRVTLQPIIRSSTALMIDKNKK